MLIALPLFALQGRINTLRSSLATDGSYADSHIYKCDIQLSELKSKILSFQGISSNCWSNPLKRQNWLEFHLITSQLSALRCAIITSKDCHNSIIIVLTRSARNLIVFFFPPFPQIGMLLESHRNQT